ncbi:nucleotide-binding protein [Chitinophaga tropicalis]|uniref:CD-NTase-associated protein 12/Pycsar effector protein TIR domain-containing protein n=1 Tax=Chitinophaga tropicalis TaxID=2683588 RepID=A0A7K1UAU4_9BACT|nr:nucleotide-binding protein [Chitinophaga tropicalis]MVT11398.1 hypothetical protein [Chitinophaga tropicalis]
MSTPKPFIFIGCSSEGLELAKNIQFQLQNIARTKIWNQGVFPLGESILEGLIQASDDFDYAILILSADDESISRNVRQPVSRDNVLFELGLFMGKLGRKKTFAVYDAHKRPKIISDLEGIILATYDSSDNDLSSSLGPACYLISQTIKDTFQIQKSATTSFWKSYMGNNYHIVIGRFQEFQNFEPTGFLAVGDARGLSDICAYLESIGSKVPQIEYADKMNGDFLGNDLIIIGGPDANELCKATISRLNLTIKFGNPEKYEVSFRNNETGDRFVPKIINNKVQKDFGVIIKAPNPFNPKRNAVLLFGAFGYGTWAAIKYATSLDFLENKIVSEQYFECIVETEVVKDTPQALREVFLKKLDL